MTTRTPQKSDRSSRRSRARQRFTLPRTVDRRHAVGLAAIAALGASVSVHLTYTGRLLLAGASGGRFCAVGTWVDCDAVLTSPFASIAGVPLSLLGVWFYAVTGAIAIGALRRTRAPFPRSPAAMLFAAYALATAVSLLLAAASITVIGSFCLFCIFLYTLNLAGLAIAWRAVRATGETAWRALTTEVASWVAERAAAIRYSAKVLLFLLVLVVASEAFREHIDVCDVMTNASLKRRTVELAVFSDFQCPRCQELHRALRPVHENPLVHVLLRHYPLDGQCNSRIWGRGHRGSCLQARAAICADRQGRGLEYTDRLFADGPTEESDLITVARSMGIDGSLFAACLRSSETSALLGRDVNAGHAENVKVTPTLFLNGRRLAGVPTSDEIACLRRGGAATQASRK